MKRVTAPLGRWSNKLFILFLFLFLFIYFFPFVVFQFERKDMYLPNNRIETFGNLVKTTLGAVLSQICAKKNPRSADRPQFVARPSLFGLFSFFFFFLFFHFFGMFSSLVASKRKKYTKGGTFINYFQAKPHLHTTFPQWPIFACPISHKLTAYVHAHDPPGQATNSTRDPPPAPTTNQQTHLADFNILHTHTHTHTHAHDHHLKS